MKRVVFATLLVVFAAASTRAELFWYDTMGYPAGNIITNSDGLWIRHSGSAGNSLVVGLE